jgi:hypothetical protein
MDYQTMPNSWADIDDAFIIEALMALAGVEAVQITPVTIFIGTQLVLDIPTVTAALDAIEVPPVWNIGGFEFEQLGGMDATQWTDDEVRSILMEVIKRLS